MAKISFILIHGPNLCTAILCNKLHALVSLEDNWMPTNIPRICKLWNCALAIWIKKVATLKFGPKRFYTLKSLLADMDGLLLNTESFYTVVQKQLCKQYGREFTWDLKSKVQSEYQPPNLEIWMNLSCVRLSATSEKWDQKIKFKIHNELASKLSLCKVGPNVNFESSQRA